MAAVGTATARMPMATSEERPREGIGLTLMERGTRAPGAIAPSGAALVPVALVVLLVVVATWYDGAFHMRQWAPAALLTLVTLVAYVLSARVAVASRAVRVALVA